MKKKIAIAVIFVCGILAFFVPYFFSNSWRNVELKREVIQSDIYERKDLLRCPMYSMRGIIRWSPMRSILRIHGYCGAHPLRRSGLSSVRDMVFYIPERHREIDVDKAFRLPFFLRQHIRFTQGVV